MAGVGNFQVDGTTHRERSRGAGSTERCYDNEQLLMGGGALEGGGKLQIPRNGRDRWDGMGWNKVGNDSDGA